MHCQAVYSPQATLDLGHQSRNLKTNYIRYSHSNLVLESSSHSAHAVLTKSFSDRLSGGTTRRRPVSERRGKYE